MKPFYVALIPAAVLSLGVTAAQAADDSPLSFYVGAGPGYDSNITVDPQDISTNQSDVSLSVEAGAGAEFGSDETVKINAGYDFYQTFYESVDGFNLQTHTVSLGASKTVNDLDLGLDYSFNHIRLGGDALLNINSISPSVGTFVGDKLYLVGAYEYQDRNYDVLNQRDATRHAASVDAYYFFSGRQYLYGSYEIAHEDARGSEFTYLGNYFTVGYRSSLNIASRDVKTELRYRYYIRDYSNETPSIGEERSDKRHNINAKATVPLAGAFELELGYEFIGANSNLPSADYNEHIVSSMVRWRY
jgi:hypothetical protein